MTIPTLTKMVKVYTESAAVERLKCGKPDEGTVRNTLAGVRQFKRWLNQRRAAEAGRHPGDRPRCRRTPSRGGGREVGVPLRRSGVDYCAEVGGTFALKWGTTNKQARGQHEI